MQMNGDLKKINIIIALSLFFGVGCTHTKSGTHVEVIEMNGREAYVAGAAGIGKSQTLACRFAIQRAAKAVSHRFAQEHEDLGDDVAEALGAEDGASFLYGFVNQQILSMPVQDVSFDPTEHTCLATVRWQPPVFLKKALMKYGEALKAEETQDNKEGKAAAPPANDVNAEQDSGPSEVAPRESKAVTAAPKAPEKKVVCASEKRKIKQANRVLGEKESILNECKRRTNGDADACYRYGLYVEKAQIAKEEATLALRRCEEVEQ
tara:strand:- start:169 stop:960 length:792 start_codon:yes stop_codon:yes gene_type:complete